MAHDFCAPLMAQHGPAQITHAKVAIQTGQLRRIKVSSKSLCSRDIRPEAEYLYDAEPGKNVNNNLGKFDLAAVAGEKRETSLADDSAAFPAPPSSFHEGYPVSIRPVRPS